MGDVVFGPDWSIAFWLKCQASDIVLNSLKTYVITQFDCGFTSYNQTIDISIESSYGYYGCIKLIIPTINTYYITPNICDGTWYYVAIIYNSSPSTICAYVNNVLYSTPQSCCNIPVVIRNNS